MTQENHTRNALPTKATDPAKTLAELLCGKEPPRQTARAAAEALIRDRPGDARQVFLSMALEGLRRARVTPTADVLDALIGLAALGLKAHEDRPMKRTTRQQLRILATRSLSLADIGRTLAFAEETAYEWRRNLRTIHEDLAKTGRRPTHELLCELYAERFRGTLPPALRPFLSAPRSFPYDAHHDGNLVRSRDLWGLGIVRLARILTPEAAKHFDNLLVETADASGQLMLGGATAREALSVRRTRRTLVVTDRLSPVILKLIDETHVADANTAVLLTVPDGALAAQHSGNLAKEFAETGEDPVKGALTAASDPQRIRTYAAHFAERGIPFLVDRTGAMRTLLRVDALPAVVEPRHGGWCVYAATGEVHRPTRADEGVTVSSVPAWLRTLAEAQLVSQGLSTETLLQDAAADRALFEALAETQAAYEAEKCGKPAGDAAASDAGESPADATENPAREVPPKRTSKRGDGVAGKEPPRLRLARERLDLLERIEAVLSVPLVCERDYAADIPEPERERIRHRRAVWLFERDRFLTQLRALTAEAQAERDRSDARFRRKVEARRADAERREEARSERRANRRNLEREERFAAVRVERKRAASSENGRDTTGKTPAPAASSRTLTVKKD